MTSRTVLARASMEAARLHARLNTSMDGPVDVFAVVQALRVWLTAQPLDNGVFGYFVRQGEATGICLNAQHPEPLQRYTCAHELGHFMLGHGNSIDSSDTMLTYRSNFRETNEEAQAEAFASTFLMPTGLVNRVSRNLGLRDKPALTPEDVYAISRDLDVSYAAAAWRLVHLQRLVPEVAQQYINAGANAAKTSIRGRPPIGDARAALYEVVVDAERVSAACRVGDEVRLHFPERSSSGYRWELRGAARDVPRNPVWDGADIISVGDQGAGLAPSADDIGTLGDRRNSSDALGEVVDSQITVVPSSPGLQTFTFDYRRPWESDDRAPLRTAQLLVDARPMRALSGFAPRQPAAHAARFAA